MGCQLGFNNEDNTGGSYKGKNIGKFLGNIYLQLARNGNIEVENSPSIYLEMRKKKMDKNNPPFDPEAPFIYEVFGRDEHNRVDDITCIGFKNDEPDNCKKCPYYQE